MVLVSCQECGDCIIGFDLAFIDSGGFVVFVKADKAGWMDDLVLDAKFLGCLDVKSSLEVERFGFHEMYYTFYGLCLLFIPDRVI